MVLPNGLRSRREVNSSKLGPLESEKSFLSFPVLIITQVDLCYYTIELRRAASLNQEALSFGVRFWVLKSTCTRPKRVP